MAGEVLPGRYTSPTLVARGGMGEVYRATDSVLGRAVAVKVLSERYAREESIRARFEREASTAARLSGKPHVITVFDVGEHGGRPFIVMEFLDGGSLYDRLRAGPVPAETALDWLGQAAQELDHAHAVGVVHRDVKPANLLLDGDGNVRVSDFGIASVGGEDTLTLPGTVLGTAGYLSPEQARGEPATASSDRYALGAVAFELLTGRRPFESETAATEAFAHVNAPVPTASEVRPDLPEAVDGVLERALAKEPETRPGSAAELVRSLREAVAPASLPAASPVVAPAPHPPARSVHRARRRPYALLGLGAAVLLVAAVTLAAVLGVAGGSEAPGAREAGDSDREIASRSVEDGERLNDVGFERMQEGDYERALPALVAAVEALRDSGTLTEAYARYNLAATRFALGHCTGILTPLERSEAIQGFRSEIEELRSEWRVRCAPPPPETTRDDGPGRGKKKGHGNEEKDD
jgi:tRNA A-37 threonylcarbamoyl transferase component Bud32